MNVAINLGSRSANHHREKIKLFVSFHHVLFKNTIHMLLLKLKKESWKTIVWTNRHCLWSCPKFWWHCWLLFYTPFAHSLLPTVFEGEKRTGIICALECYSWYKFHSTKKAFENHLQCCPQIPGVVYIYLTTQT